MTEDRKINYKKAGLAPYSTTYDQTREELEELCEVPGDQGCADQLKSAALDGQLLKNDTFLKNEK